MITETIVQTKNTLQDSKRQVLSYVFFFHSDGMDIDLLKNNDNVSQFT